MACLGRRSKETLRLSPSLRLMRWVTRFCQGFEIIWNKGVREHLCRGRGQFCAPLLATLWGPPLKNPLFWKNIDNFFNYVNYSIIYIIHTSKLQVLMNYFCNFLKWTCEVSFLEFTCCWRELFNLNFRICLENLLYQRRLFYPERRLW